MLELRNIKKDYPIADDAVHALQGIDLRFRESEFVSVLGPSGCGKTTLLNIIGGLDQYTSGDLLINGRTTKRFRDRDWDAYRNHSIGFVFQSYNLIPHQTVLSNVELALTIAGISKAERRARAKAALVQVGLGEQLNKRPNQMSGGQMQRVAIARALVNDPEILLADEPTGALDTETSVQVMEILKKIASDRLVIMVTHNPNLAQQYSSRIIQMLDGKITADSAPLTDEEYRTACMLDDERSRSGVKDKKPTMAFHTAFMLSLNNLFTKKGRTMLTAFAGSIGIMGIALILAVSQGTTAYINDVQEDTLSSYPLTIEQTSVDMTQLMQSFMNLRDSEADHAMDAVYKKSAIYDMLTAMNNLDSHDNDLTAFKTYLEQQWQIDDADGGLAQAMTGIQYSYDLDLQVYTKNIDGEIIHSDTTQMLREMMAQYMGMGSAVQESESSSTVSNLQSMSQFGRSSMQMWQELLPAQDGAPVNELVKNQYDVVYGAWPQSYDEVVLVLDKNNELDDLTLYALGLESEERIRAIEDAAYNGAEIEFDDATWSYEEIRKRPFRVILSADCYTKDADTGLFQDLRETDAGLQYLYDNAMELKIVGIVRPNADAQSAMLNGSIGYTNALTQHVIEKAHSAEIIAAQRADSETDVLTGLPFEDVDGTRTDEEKAQAFRDYAASADEERKAQLYTDVTCIPEQERLDVMTDAAMKNYTIADMREAVKQALLSQMGLDENSTNAYLDAMDDDKLTELFRRSVSEQVEAQYAAQVREQLAPMNTQQRAGALDMALDGYTTQQAASYYDKVMEFSQSTYDENLKNMGYVELDSPATINVFASTFENKDAIEDAIAAYNDGLDELSQIKYTDYVGILMSTVTTIINAITYVLLAFVAISLLVSSIMIGVITLISVQERTKEIGVLRAIGASKRDVSSMFNAETIIIGCASGLLGVGVTYLLCIPINLLLHQLTGIASLNAVLPPVAAGILVLISIVLSLFAGLIPSASAAKKDPVEALRTE